MAAGRLTPTEDSRQYMAGALARLDRAKRLPHEVAIRRPVGPAATGDSVQISSASDIKFKKIDLHPDLEIADSSPALFEQKEGTKPEDLGFMLPSGGKMDRGEVIAAVSATRAERTMGL